MWTSHCIITALSNDWIPWSHGQFLKACRCYSLCLYFWRADLFFGERPPEDIIMTGYAFIGLVLLGFGMGVTNAVLFTMFPSWAMVSQIVSRPMFLLSGIFYSVDSMPPQLWEYLLWNPVLHGVENFRLGMLVNYQSNSADFSYLFWFGTGLTFISIASLRVFHRRLSSKWSYLKMSANDTAPRIPTR